MKHSLSRRGFLSSMAVLGGTVALGPEALAAASITPVKIHVFTKPFQELSARETARRVEEMGYDGIECPVRAKGQIEPEKAADQLPLLLEALKEHNKELALMTTDIKQVTPQAETLLRTASKLGIKRYRLGFFNYTKEKSIPDQLRELKAQLKELGTLNRELGLQGGFQNHSGATNIGAPIWDIYEVIRELDPREMGNCFDIGHATLEGGYAWPTQARLMRPFFTAVYVKDFAWKKTSKGWKAEWCPLGEGMVNRAFFTTLKQSGYTGPIVQHHEYPMPEAREEQLKFFQKDLALLRSWLA